MKSRFFLLALCCLAVFVSCAGKPEFLSGEEKVFGVDTFAADRGAYPSSFNLFPEYTLGPGDVLDVLFQIQTWNIKKKYTLAIDHTVTVKFVHAPELNETQNVQPDGKISLPYIGEIQVVGLTLGELTEILKEKYARVLRNPQLYVTVPEFRIRIKELKKDLHTASRGLSRLVTVRPDGYCTFPLAGDVFVANRTIPEVNEELDGIYESYLPGLHVDLFLEHYSGSVVYVLGQVFKGGAFNISKPVGIAEAVAMAGGEDDSADLSRVVVFRRKGDKVHARGIDLEEMLTMGINAEYFYLKPDDIVYVPKKTLTAVAEIVRDIATIVQFRGWSLSGELFENAIFDR